MLVVRRVRVMIRKEVATTALPLRHQLATGGCCRWVLGCL
jgi:hypothetical protein